MLNATSNDNKPSLHPENHPHINSVQSDSFQYHSVEKTATTDRVLPGTDSQELQRREILHAFQEGSLGCRSVRIFKEKSYLFQQNQYPRPVYILLRGCDIDAMPSTLGILDLEPLACYKQNAITHSYNFPLDSLKQKCISTLTLHIKKMEEQRERKCWEVYKLSTSGHLKPNGSFSLPKFKKAKIDDSIHHSEVILSQYKKDQIKTYCITDKLMRLSDIFENKHKLEHAFNLPCLPLSIYSSSQGKLDVYFEEELNLQCVLLKQNEERLERFCMSRGIQLESLWKIMNTLPFPLKLEILQSAKFNVKNTEDKTAEIINILANPDQYSIRKFRKIAPDNVCNMVFYQGCYHSLMQILIHSEIDRFTSIENHPEIDLNSYTNTHTSREALSLFHELLRKGCHLDDFTLHDIAGGAPIFFDSTVARYHGSSGDGLAFANIDPDRKARPNESLFYLLPENSAGRTVSMDQAFRNMPHDVIQATLEFELTSVLMSLHNLNPRLNKILLILFYYGANPTPLKQRLIKDISRFKAKFTREYLKIFGTISPSEYVNSIISLWQNRETDSYYLHWPKKVEIAQQEITRLRQSIGLPENDQGMEKTSILTQSKLPFQFLIDALSKPLILAHARDDNETILQILDHYYRRPGPRQVGHYLSAASLPGIWKSSHSCSHALRARNNVHWYMELLAKFQVMQFSDKEKALLSLAVIYHDAAAEDVPKDKEASVSAGYFKRDLTGHFPQPLLEKVALALESKEDDGYGKDSNNLDPQVRNYLRVLRFADRMDFIRCAVISRDFPNFSGRTKRKVFDPWRLDLPLAAIQHEAFQRHLIAAMHGAVDLASLTGGLKKGNDLREKRDYASRHHLEPNGRNLTLSFERTPVPVMMMDRFLDNMVRIKIAEEAGLPTCLDAEHQQCRADPINGVTWGIHNSWYDLKHINVPEGMTPLEKMQSEHSLDVLRETTRRAIQTEVERLKQVGIPMNLGTLTQKTLKSPKARAVLKRRGISVIRERRPRGFKPSGKRHFETLLVPQESLPSPDTRANQHKRKIGAVQPSNSREIKRFRSDDEV